MIKPEVHKMRTFDCNKVKPSKHLVVLSYRQLVVARREAKLADRKATEVVKRVREFDAPVVAGFKPPKIRRGKSGCRMSHANRLLVLQKASDRAAFFAAIES
jgi:hypothetical protein